jgi:hypothetical protein
VQRLEEAVLHSVPAPPHHTGTVRSRDGRAVEAHGLAEAFHHQLLQVARQQLQALVVRQHACVAKPTRCDSTPPSTRASSRGFRAARLQHVRIHLRRAGEQLSNAGMPSASRSATRPPTTANNGRRPNPTSAGCALRECPLRRARDVGGDREQARVVAEPLAQDRRR